MVDMPNAERKGRMNLVRLGKMVGKIQACVPFKSISPKIW
jgi:hypothetical protein